MTPCGVWQQFHVRVQTVPCAMIGVTELQLLREQECLLRAIWTLLGTCYSLQACKYFADFTGRIDQIN